MNVESFEKIMEGHYLLTIQIVLIVFLTILGLFTLSELSERERLISYYQVQLNDVERKMLSNFQATLNDEAYKKENKLPNASNGSQSNYVWLKISSSLVAERKDLNDKYTKLEQLIIQGNENERSTNALMASLILLATVTGSLVQSLREIEGKDELPDFLIRLSSGLGAGIVCALFLTSNGLSSSESFSFFPSFGPSMKTLIGFLVGMFSKELYELLADGVPALFKFIKAKIPTI